MSEKLALKCHRFRVFNSWFKDTKQKQNLWHLGDRLSEMQFKVHLVYKMFK